MKFYNNIKVLCVVFVVKTITSSSTNIPKFIRPCDTMSSECLMNAIQFALPGFIKGVPELGIISLDPFVVEKFDLNLPGLIMKFRDGYVKGFSNCIVDHARMFQDTLQTQFHCNLTIRGKYKSSGRLIMFSIDGDGDSAIKCRNLKINLDLNLSSTIGANGQTYLVIKNYTSSHSYDGRVSYRMTNMLRGNPEISKMVLDFMNRNWRMVAEEFGDPIVEYGFISVMKNIMRLFETVPMNQLIAFPI